MKTRNKFLVILAASFAIVVSFLFGYYFNSLFSKRYANIEEYTDGIQLATLSTGGKVLLNNSGEQMSPVETQFSDVASHDDSIISYTDRDGYCGYFNLKSRKVIIDAVAKKFSKAWRFDNVSGLAAVQDVKTKKIGFINRSGTYNILPSFKSDNRIDYVFSEDGRCIVCTQNNNFMLIDETGRNVMDTITFTDIEEIFHGFRKVETFNGKCGLLKNNQSYIPCKYDNITVENDAIVITNKGRMWSLNYDLTLKAVMLFEDISAVPIIKKRPSLPEDKEFFETEEASNKRLSNHFQRVEINGKFGVYNSLKRRMIVPAIYDRIYAIGNERSWVAYGEKDEYIYPLGLEK